MAPLKRPTATVVYAKNEVTRRIPIRHMKSMCLCKKNLQIRRSLRSLGKMPYTTREWLISGVRFMLACLLFSQLFQRLGPIHLAPATWIQEQECPSLNGARRSSTLFGRVRLSILMSQLTCMHFCLQPGST